MTAPGDARSQASQDALSAADELDRAAAHLRTAAIWPSVRYRATPLICWLRGALLAGQTLDVLATTHARRSQTGHL
ncbi:hypothetical protein [Deinococcus soli (ex Cha et al. 2016)]|uniref:Uncharacterized protein n=2 Tax=Deinococcus soli (ex Cha et al. 2016) TaxID=1309411 RepID=A0AAE3XFL3_9DEIO|nr:hypothetical protein [Deinococcus soli (ex Cha et al. 2016)]MDR6220406.1 hypothetical protein [Deinococcus soli (ex Cha et al. 2016)]MDR6330263.1 hypothetical protein [Deinococcus soli (ex Cha et al. 2016)]MDR6753487.1 hypothetical protein [Deinococcus soli (ex Cha et al. 2016)]